MLVYTAAVQLKKAFHLSIYLFVLLFFNNIILFTVLLLMKLSLFYVLKNLTFYALNCSFKYYTRKFSFTFKACHILRPFSKSKYPYTYINKIKRKKMAVCRL